MASASFAFNAAGETHPRRRTGLFRRVLGAMIEARQRQADREVARVLAGR